MLHVLLLRQLETGVSLKSLPIGSCTPQIGRLSTNSIEVLAQGKNPTHGKMPRRK